MRQAKKLQQPWTTTSENVGRKRERENIKWRTWTCFMMCVCVCGANSQAEMMKQKDNCSG